MAARKPTCLKRGKNNRCLKRAKRKKNKCIKRGKHNKCLKRAK
jgi:hypothetical protein